MNADSISDSLLVRLKNRDDEAWKRLVRIYGPEVFKWARLRGLKPEDAADVAQNVWRKVDQNIWKFERTEKWHSFGRWLQTITRNTAMNVHRDRRKRAEDSAQGGSDAREVIENLGDEVAVQYESEPVDSWTAILHRTLEELKPKCGPKVWQAFYETAVKQRTTKEVAEELEITAEMVRVYRARVMQRLRLELEGLEDFDTETDE